MFHVSMDTKIQSVLVVKKKDLLWSDKSRI